MLSDFVAWLYEDVALWNHDKVVQIVFIKVEKKYNVKSQRHVNLMPITLGESITPSTSVTLCFLGVCSLAGSYSFNIDRVNKSYIAVFVGV